VTVRLTVTSHVSILCTCQSISARYNRASFLGVLVTRDANTHAAAALFSVTTAEKLKLAFASACVRRIYGTAFIAGWLGSRVVSVLDSGAEGPGFKSQPRRSLKQTVHTHYASVHQAAKLVAALLRVAKVTAGLAESNGSLPPGF